MSPYTGSRELVLALQPSARGPAYVLFEGPQSPVSLRMKDMRGRKKLARAFEEVTELVTCYEPEIVVLEDVLAIKTASSSGGSGCSG